MGIQTKEDYEKWQELKKTLSFEFYSPSSTKEFYDVENDIWYNQFGQTLRNPNEYDATSEGYTPFGDE